MTTQTEQALTLALEALIDIKYGLEGARIWGGMDWHYNQLHPVKYIPLRDKAEAAMEVCKEALAAQQGEPVAWMCSNNELMHKGYQRFSSDKGGDWDIPVYLHPAPAPLSDEQIAEIVDRNWGSAWDAKAFVPIVREIERHVRGV